MLEILNDRPMENMGQLDGNTWTLVFACFFRMKCCRNFTLIELATEATQNGDNQTT